MKTSGHFFVATALVVFALAACSDSDDTSVVPADASAADSTPAADASVADTSVADASVADTSVADTSVADAGPTAFGCDFAPDGGHTCTDYVYTNIPLGLFETAKTQCAALNATVLAACDHTGAVGGCTKTETKNTITTVTTTWQYTGTPTSVMALCATQAGYTYVAP